MSGSGRAIRSPNIWDTPEVYELENLASDRAGVIDAAIAALHPLRGAVLVDVGCGTGFHLPRFAERGATVLGVEPYLPLVRRAANRLRAKGSRARVVAGSAEALPVADASVDVVHARWAYFFGAGCEPGLAELERVLRPGGVACLVDNDATRSTFGGWFARAYPAYDPVAVQRFWDRQGFTTQALTIRWTFDRREDLEAVVRIELPPGPADAVLAEHEGLEVDYAVALRWRRS
ncbi:class I SAM-dependent methyltransferase [Phycicoccus jejuensis]|uniref:class I SAM-dependent methyltransferase n=1 Tax=Phycicoccus TaxID=367298 RepID=UPI001A8E7893|nr:class I SAM-dependent methyltransferase [Phycicoccus sp. DTK01]GIL35307.1 methyltransferase type 11 [Phycicoccus sp. DTK01]